MNQVKKCVLYAQIGNPEQIKQGYSLEEQRKLLEKYAGENNMGVEKVFLRSLDAENSLEVFVEMLKFVKEMKVEVIVFASRNFLSMSDCIDLDSWLNELPTREAHFIDLGYILTKNSDDVKKEIDWDVDIDLARYYFRSLRRAVITKVKGRKK